MSSDPEPPVIETNRCGAPDAIEGICPEPATHEIEVNAPVRGHDVSRRCANCAAQARGRPYVVGVRPITLDVDAEEAAAAIYDHYRYVRATHANIDYTPSVRVDTDSERLRVARGSVLYIREESPWRPAYILVEDVPDYYRYTRPAWRSANDWLTVASTCVRETIVDADGREWSLPTDVIAAALREGTFLDGGGSR